MIPTKIRAPVFSSQRPTVINKEGQLEFQLNKNPWKLVNIIDWNNAGTLK